MGSALGLSCVEADEKAENVPRCGGTMSRKREICAECEACWTGTHYAKQPLKGGDAMLRRVPGSLGTGKRR